MDVDVVIEETARDAAAEADRVATEEATKDAAAEAAKDAAEEAAKNAAAEAAKESIERADTETGDHTDGIPAAGALGTDPNAKASVAGKAVVGDDPSTSKEAPSKQASQGWRQLIRLHPGNGQHWSAN